ncbi:MAG TPA: ATP-binding protein [Longimicrobiales bacterium]|nr:ATP-binding protein [Longimicrobiales bacterium]
MARERTLERRLFSWILGLTLLPALLLLAGGSWALSTSLDVAGALGPWEQVAESGADVVERARPDADPELEAALDRHREALSSSLTQARRWAFLGTRFQSVLPLLVLGVALALLGLAWLASRILARQFARPISDLVRVAERLGSEEPLPPPISRTVVEVRVLDDTLRRSARQLAEARDRALAAERLRVWGEMARRVAHEMKNPLTPLRLAAHRLRLAQEPGVAEVHEVLTQEVERLEELAGQFAALGRPPEGPPTEIDVPEMLASLLETDVPPTVDAGLEAAPDAPSVIGHHDALLRAFRNLLANAVQAMENTPEPRLRVAITAATPPVAGGGAAEASVPWLEVRISDNGAGLPPGPADRIFEPDFTTKEKGTGLGLALVKQAVETHGGRIRAVRREAGVEMIIRLPARSSEVPHEG